MPKKFETGTKNEVMYAMSIWAIENAWEMIDRLTPRFDEPSEEDKEHIKNLKAMIRDFEKVQKGIK